MSFAAYLPPQPPQPPPEPSQPTPEQQPHASPTSQPQPQPPSSPQPKRRRGRRLPNFLRVAEIEQLLAAAAAAVTAAHSPGKRRAAQRDLCMVQTGLLLGLRVSELCKLQIENIDADGGFIAIVAGKGDKDRTLPLPARLVPILREWIATHRGGARAGWLFPATAAGTRRMSPRTFQTRLATLGKAAGITKRCKPHGLRHTFATRLLESGAAIHEVSELMGHSSISTTQVYLHTVPERLRGAVDRL